MNEQRPTPTIALPRGAGFGIIALEVTAGDDLGTIPVDQLIAAFDKAVADKAAELDV